MTIENMLQYHVTKRQLRLMLNHLDELQQRHDRGVAECTLSKNDQRLSAAAIAGQQSMIDTLRRELYEFELHFVNSPQSE